MTAFAALGLAGLIFDHTPLLVEPSPDFDLPLGMLGIGMGLWSAHRISGLPYLSGRTLSRLSLWIMLPLFLGLGLAALGDQVHEAASFNRKGLREEITVLIAEKAEWSSRSGRAFFEAQIINPFDGGRVTIRVDRATFRRIEPLEDCVTLLIERAPNGAARLLMPLRWKARCPEGGFRIEPRE